MYSKIINKFKYQMTHKPSKQKPSCTKNNVSAETQYLHTAKPYTQYHNKKTKNKKTVVCTWQQD